ncbi:hypothetical protein [Streptomyces olivaceus]|uniref:hypothetical protein n=1 Tax=Streptomyces olivaceus TaxID=47716 RepID=UPI00379946C8
MPPDLQRGLIPRDDTTQLIVVLDTLKSRLHDAYQQWTLLDENGHIPAAPSPTMLLHHAADAQGLSHEVLHVTAGFADSGHSTTRVGSTVLKYLAAAATESSQAAPHFAEAANAALLLARSSPSAEQHHSTHRMVIDHASARACLRRSSRSLSDAATELDQHLALHRFLTSMTPQHPSPGPSPSTPSPRHR